MTTQTVNFTAFNNVTKKRESFSCQYSQDTHSNEHDAATSKLWYGESWSRDQLAHADVTFVCDKKRQHTADCAWYLVREMGWVNGLSLQQVISLLDSSSISRIETDAWMIQEDLATRVADALRPILVGRLVHEPSARASFNL